jgi:hypothetical protein
MPQQCGVFFESNFVMPDQESKVFNAATQAELDVQVTTFLGANPGWSRQGGVGQSAKGQFVQILVKNS